jgi:hypothetical protein
VDAAPVVVGEVGARRTPGLVDAESGDRGERQQYAAQREALITVSDQRWYPRSLHLVILAVG